MKKDRDGVKVRGREKRALQVSSEAGCSVIIERRAAAERDNQSACSANARR